MTYIIVSIIGIVLGVIGYVVGAILHMRLITHPESLTDQRNPFTGMIVGAISSAILTISVVALVVSLLFYFL